VGIGDHKCFILDFTSVSLLGDVFPKVVTSKGWKLHLLTTSEFRLLMNKWDNEFEDYMRSTKNQCNSFKDDRIEWSPKVGVWLTMRWMLGRVNQFLKGKVPDPQNLYRDCKKNGISDPRRMTRDKLHAEVASCTKELE